jgi:hypothetical protein
MEYYSAIKNNGVGHFRKIDGTEDYHVELDKSSSER